MTSSKKPHVLLAEDDEFLRKVLEKQFSKEFELTAVSDGEQALEKIAESIPDIILLDIIMPKKDGFEVLKELKKQGITEKIPVLMLSNLGQESDVDECIKNGAKEFLIKANMPLYEITAVIKKHLEKEGTE
jgi:CheY-like chemotaxis protein